MTTQNVNILGEIVVETLTRMRGWNSFRQFSAQTTRIMNNVISPLRMVGQSQGPGKMSVRLDTMRDVFGSALDGIRTRRVKSWDRALSLEELRWINRLDHQLRDLSNTVIR